MTKKLVGVYLKRCVFFWFKNLLANSKTTSKELEHSHIKVLDVL